jgi:hypothetical protein
VEIGEFVPGGYQLEAVHIDGRSVTRTGTDPYTLLKEFKAEIAANPEDPDA